MDTHARTGRRWTRLTLALAVLIAVSAPVAVFAAGGHFTDDEDSIFEAHINWMADAGVTLGCNPPDNDHYCPDDNVTRGEMAAFMHRLADNQVVDAGHLNGEPGSHYENRAYSRTCHGNNCNDGSALAVTQILQLDVPAPEAGLLVISQSYSANQVSASSSYTQAWVNVDETDCGGWFGGPFAATPGTWTVASVMGDISFTASSATTALAVDQGTHTLRLCAIGIAAIDSQEASLTATFTSGGSVSAVSSEPAGASPDYSQFIDGYEGVVQVGD